MNMGKYIQYPQSTYILLYTYYIRIWVMSGNHSTEVPLGVMADIKENIKIKTVFHIFIVNFYLVFKNHYK